MKLKQVLTVGLTLTLILALFVPVFAQNFKIGYLNSQKIVTTHKGFLDAQKKIEQIKQNYEKEIMDMQKELQTLYEQFESQSLLLSDSKKAEKQQEMQGLDLKIKEYYQIKLAPGQGEIYKQQEELMAPINEKINKLIEQFGDEGKYDIIYDEVVGNILYANKDKKVDITDKLLTKLSAAK